MRTSVTQNHLRVSCIQLFFVFAIIFIVGMRSSAHGQGKMTLFDTEMKNPEFLGFCGGQWYFKSDNDLCIFDNKLKLVSKSELQIPKDWKKWSFLSSKVVDNKVIALVTTKDGDVRTFSAYSLDKDGVLSNFSKVNSSAIQVEESRRAIIGDLALIDGWHVGFETSPNKEWSVIEHITTLKDKSKRVTYLTLDRSFNLVSKFEQHREPNNETFDLAINDEGAIFFSIYNTSSPKYSDRLRIVPCEEMLLFVCSLGKTQPLGPISVKQKGFVFQDIFIKSQDNGGCMLYCLLKESSEAIYPSTMATYHWDQASQNFITEDLVDIWGKNLENKPAGFYEEGQWSRDFRIRAVNMESDGFRVVFDDYRAFDFSSDKDISIHQVITYAYVLSYKGKNAKLDYLALDRAEKNSSRMGGYSVLIEPNSDIIQFFVNELPRRINSAQPHQPKVIKNVMAVYKPGLQKEPIGAYIFEPGKGFKFEKHVDAEKTNGYALNTSESPIPVGEGKYIFFFRKRAAISDRGQAVLLQL